MNRPAVAARSSLSEVRESSLPLIAHIVFRFDYGGLENGVVNLVNRMPGNLFRHCIIALTEATEFQQRIQKPGVLVHCIGKRPGKDLRSYARLYRLLRELKPAVVHTRNLGTVECLFVAWLAGSPVRIHGEHGWDIYDPFGANRKYRMLRLFMNRFIDRFVTVSTDLAEWLSSLGIPDDKIIRICNGVDTERFHPLSGNRPAALPTEIFPPGSVIVGSVTRFSAIKDPINLINAFIELQQGGGEEAARCRLLMVGDGDLRAEAEMRVCEAGVQDKVWLTGSRDDVPELLRCMHVFVLGSLREGISNTILEAMASGLPVIAAATGGNGELVVDGVTGKLVPPGNPKALALAIQDYIGDADKREQQGSSARARADSTFSLSVMVDDYRRLYTESLQQAGA